MKKTLLTILSLLLIVGCSKPINADKLVKRNGVVYLVNSNEPYSGEVFSLYENGQKEYETTYKDGEEDGLWTGWYDNGQKEFEKTYKDGVIISSKCWDEDGNEIQCS